MPGGARSDSTLGRVVEAVVGASVRGNLEEGLLAKTSTRGAAREAVEEEERLGTNEPAPPPLLSDLAPRKVREEIGAREWVAPQIRFGFQLPWICDTGWYRISEFYTFCRFLIRIRNL